MLKNQKSFAFLFPFMWYGTETVGAFVVVKIVKRENKFYFEGNNILFRLVWICVSVA